MTVKRERLLLMLWIVLKLAEHAFSNSASPDSAFAASSNHVAMMAVNFAVSASMIYFFIDPLRLAFNGYVVLQLIYFLYCFLTSFWSEMYMVSGGQSVYAIFGLIMSFSISSCCCRLSFNLSFVCFLRLWAKILFIDYAFRVLLNGNFFVPLDEKSLIAAVVFYGFVIVNKTGWLARLCLALIFLGNSFSAIFSASVFWLGASKKLQSTIAKFFAIMVLVAFFYLGFVLLDAGLISIYGKTIEYMQSGSGRFAVWQSLVDEISSSAITSVIFGHGYMSERAFLSRLELPWGIDAHSNALQTIYGVGAVGAVLVIAIWAWPLLNKKFKNAIAHVPFLKSWVLASNFAFIVFGLTSSHYYSRPSLSAVFMTSFVFLVALSSRLRGVHQCLLAKIE